MSCDEKTCPRGFRPGPTKNQAVQPQTMASLEVLDTGSRGTVLFMTVYEAKTKALISCAVTIQLICTFVFAYAKSRFSHDAAHIEYCYRQTHFIWMG